MTDSPTAEWITQQFREAYRLIPDADLVDGLEANDISGLNYFIGRSFILACLTVN